MKRTATALLATGLVLLLFSSTATAQYVTEWSFVGDDKPTWFGAVTERNIAYGVVGGNERLYVTSRSGGINRIRVLDPDTGAEVPGVNISTAGISQGTVTFNTIDVSDDGKIIVGNLSVSTSAGDPFKVYLWEDESAEPQTIINYTEGGYRLSDNIDIKGSVTDGTAVIYVAAGTNPAVLRWSMIADLDNPGSFVFDDAPVVTDPLPNMPAWGTPGFVIGKEPGASRFIAGGRSNTFLREYRADGTTAGLIDWPAGDANRNVNSAEYFEHDNGTFIATYHPTLRRANIIELNPAAADGLFANRYVAPPYGATPETGTLVTGNTNTYGDVALRTNADGTVTLFVLATDNGIAAYTANQGDFAPPTFEVELTGNPGWRMLSSPVSGATYGELLDGIWTQGIPGADSEDGTPNVVVYSEPDRAWPAIPSMGTVIGAADGFLAWAYEFDEPGVPGDGFPKTLSVSGIENAEVLNRALSFTDTGTLGDDGWNLVGNPFTEPIEVGGVDRDAQVSSFFYIWDPNAGVAGEYVAIDADTTPTETIAAFQGFWVKANAAGQEIDIPETAKDGAATFYGRPVDVPRLAFNLALDEVSTNAFVTFREDGQLGVDANDGFLPPLFVDSYLRLYTAREDVGRFMSHNLPQDLEGTVSIPVGVQSSAGGSFTLTWTLPDDFATEWGMTLIDTETGAEIDLRSQDSYSFTAGPSVDGDDRFRIDLAASSVSTEPGTGHVQELALHANFPNPFNQSTTIHFDLPVASDVRLAVYDVTGRRVVELVNESRDAGEHSVTWDASSVASGVYVYRLEAGGQALTRTLTIVR